jgi:hypothetical protein
MADWVLIHQGRRKRINDMKMPDTRMIHREINISLT